jgi:Tfp pilus assembly protein PilX
MCRPSRAKGVVLVVALLMLTVLSLMVVASIKGAGSSEALSNNNRTQSLAMQAAEAALRYCEEGVRSARYAKDVADANANGTPAPAANATIGSGIYASNPSSPVKVESMPNGNDAGDYTWVTKSKWNANPINANINILTTDAAGVSFLPTSMYKRMPECMAQYQDAQQLQVVITARGFGPEVSDPSATAASRQADGTEVWVQAFISF